MSPCHSQHITYENRFSEGEIIMYILPSYINYYKEDSDIYIHSNLLQNTVKLTDPAIQKEFLSIIQHGGCAELSTPLTQFLHEQELLINEADVKGVLEETKRLLQDFLLLTIMPTEGCNFRCPYCYEDHTPISMTRQMLNQLQVFISDQIPNFRFVNINWFGGEPTLCKDVILEVSALILSLKTKYHFQYTASMTTNGYLLNIKNFQQFYAAGITNYQITLDGWNHDKTRPHVSGKGTLQTILNNLVSLSHLPKEEYQFHIILRHNILAGDEDYSWYDHLYKLFGSDSRFSVSVVPVDNWGGESVQSLDLLKGNQRKSLVSSHIAYLDKIGMAKEGPTKELFSSICYASYPHGFVFRANGKIEKCTIIQDHPKNLVGYLDADKGVLLNDAANRPWCCSDLKPECYSCPDILSCFNLQCKRHAIINGCEGRCFKRSAPNNLDLLKEVD